VFSFEFETTGPWRRTIVRSRPGSAGERVHEVSENGRAPCERKADATGHAAAGHPPPSGRESAPEPLHWLLALARRNGLQPADAVSLPPAAPTIDVWRALCATGRVDADRLAEVVAGHFRLQLASSVAADSAASACIPAELAARYGVRALADDGRCLVVATIDPLSADAEQALAFACKRRVVFAVATPDSLGLAASSADPEAELESLLAGIPSLNGDVVRLEEDLDPQGVGTEDVTSEPIIKLANLILREGVRQNASDLHLEPDGMRGLIRFRVDGVLRPFMHVPLSALHRVISRYKILGRLDIADRIRPQDGRARVRIDGRAFELRLSTVPTQDAEKAVIRIAGSVQEQTLDQLEMPAHELGRLRQLLSCRDGIIVVTGPTGSGKTTTLYAALSELNDGRSNIMTVEDPIERALQGTTQIQVQPKRGVSFASSLRAILRQDPDVILIGEIRDLETAEIAVQAAMTGHLVLTTLHTTSAAGVVERLRDLGLDRTSLAASLRGVVAQRLARRVCADCAGAGCGRCESSGFRGRIPIMEVLTASQSFTEAVGRGALFHELQRTAVANGMRTIREVAAELVAQGLTTDAEIQRVIGETEEARSTASAVDPQRPALPPSAHATGAALVPVADGDAAAAMRNGNSAHQTAAERRSQTVRALLQGLDRCVAEGRTLDDVMQYACNQIASAFDSPLVWLATLDNGTLAMRVRAGSCAPWLHDAVPEWSELSESDGAVATALRTGTPQGRHIAQEPGFEPWCEHARLDGIPIFLAVPMEGATEQLGVVGVHARGLDGLDQHAGAELVTVVERVAVILERLRQLQAAGVQLAALEHAADAVFTTDRLGVIQWVNRSFTQLSGYAAVDVIGQSAGMLRSDRHEPAFYKELWDTILAGRSWRGDLFNTRRDGTCYAVEQTITPVLDDKGAVTHFLAVQRDITERKQREESVLQLVTTDPLTRLPNGRALQTELTRGVRAVADGAPEGSLLLIQLDGSDDLRGTAGPATADLVVAAVARVLADTLRPGDYLARLGEDEFAALLPGTPSDGARSAAARLHETVAAHEFAIPDLAARPSVSIGIAPIDGTLGARSVLAMADAALYGSRDRHDGMLAMHAGAAEAGAQSGDEEWARRIRDALDDDHFVLHFQPVVRLQTGAVSHYDALIRLHDDDGDVIPARAFISHAESLGLMPRIDEWVLDNVLRMLRTAPELCVSMNLSGATVTSSAFRQFLHKQSKRMSAVGARIIFEVGEVANPGDLPRVVDHMRKLQELGARFALDNFGIGAASLASLGSLPVDYVKLDGSLIRGVDADEARRDIVRGLATVARALGCEVIAGWAESAKIVELLPSLGIELAQGHYLGRPTADLRRYPEPVLETSPSASAAPPRPAMMPPWIMPASGSSDTPRIAV
jgi:general secretion pathway protein E